MLTVLQNGGLTLVGALVGALCVLASQLIAVRTAMQTKKLELFYARKVDAYKFLLEKAGEFAPDPATPEKYSLFQASLFAALIVSSDAVAEALDNPRKNGLHMNAQRLRMAKGTDALQRVQMKEWYDSMEALITAMRTDIASLADPKLGR
jgi:hypothetical protein